MPGKLPKMSDGMAERVHVHADLSLPKGSEGLVMASLMKFHTGRAGWPITMSQGEIPNSEAAVKAQSLARMNRHVSLVYDIDFDGEWHFVGVQ